MANTFKTGNILRFHIDGFKDYTIKLSDFINSNAGVTDFTPISITHNIPGVVSIVDASLSTNEADSRLIINKVDVNDGGFVYASPGDYQLSYTYAGATGPACVVKFKYSQGDWDIDAGASTTVAQTPLTNVGSVTIKKAQNAEVYLVHEYRTSGASKVEVYEVSSGVLSLRDTITLTASVDPDSIRYSAISNDGKYIAIADAGYTTMNFYTYDGSDYQTGIQTKTASQYADITQFAGMEIFCTAGGAGKLYVTDRASAKISVVYFPASGVLPNTASRLQTGGTTDISIISGFQGYQVFFSDDFTLLSVQTSTSNVRVYEYSGNTETGTDDSNWTQVGSDITLAGGATFVVPSNPLDYNDGTTNITQSVERFGDLSAVNKVSTTYHLAVNVNSLNDEDTPVTGSVTTYTGFLYYQNTGSGWTLVSTSCNLDNTFFRYGDTDIKRFDAQGGVIKFNSDATKLFMNRSYSGVITADYAQERALTFKFQDNPTNGSVKEWVPYADISSSFGSFTNASRLDDLVRPSVPGTYDLPYKRIVGFGAVPNFDSDYFIALICDSDEIGDIVAAAKIHRIAKVPKLSRNNASVTVNNDTMVLNVGSNDISRSTAGNAGETIELISYGTIPPGDISADAGAGTITVVNANSLISGTYNIQYRYKNQYGIVGNTSTIQLEKTSVVNPTAGNFTAGPFTIVDGGTIDVLGNPAVDLGTFMTSDVNVGIDSTTLTGGTLTVNGSKEIVIPAGIDIISGGTIVYQLLDANNANALIDSATITLDIVYGTIVPAANAIGAIYAEDLPLTVDIVSNDNLGGRTASQVTIDITVNTTPVATLSGDSSIVIPAGIPTGPGTITYRLLDATAQGDAPSATADVTFNYYQPVALVADTKEYFLSSAGGSIDVIDNDTIAPRDRNNQGEVLVELSNLGGIALTVSGTNNVIIPTGITPFGTKSFDYSIRDVLNGNLLVGPQTVQYVIYDTIPTTAINQNVNSFGATVSIIDSLLLGRDNADVTASIISDGGTGATFNGSNQLVVPTLTPGGYTLTFEIDDTTASGNANVGPITINLTAEGFTLANISGLQIPTSGGTIDIISDPGVDILGDNRVTGVNLIIVSNIMGGTVTVNSNNDVVVPSGLAAGNYSFTYDIERVSSGNTPTGMPATVSFSVFVQSTKVVQGPVTSGTFEENNSAGAKSFVASIENDTDDAIVNTQTTAAAIESSVTSGYTGSMATQVQTSVKQISSTVARSASEIANGTLTGVPDSARSVNNSGTSFQIKTG